MEHRSDSFGYYLLRILQRLSLFFTGLYTGIYWIVLLIVGVLAEYSAHLQNGLTDKDAAQHVVTVGLNVLLVQALIASAVCLGLTLLMLIVPSVRKYEKRLVVDGVVFAVFCAISGLTSQFAVQYFIAHYLTGIA